MRSVYLISYDIVDPKRYRRIYKLLCGHGESLQYSVFRCTLTDIELQMLKDKLWPELNLDEDRMLIVDLGPLKGRGDDCVEVWGQPREPISTPEVQII